MRLFNEEILKIGVAEYRRLFIHDGVQLYAAQIRDGKGYISLKDTPLADDDLVNHITGEVTLAVKLLQPGTNEAKAGAIDLDLGQDAETWEGLIEIARNLKKAAKKNHLRVEIEFSGRRGLHVWVFSDWPLSSEVWVKALPQLCWEAGVEPREYFPAGENIDPTGTGDGSKPIKLPLGIHRASKRRSVFIPDLNNFDEADDDRLSFDDRSVLYLQGIKQNSSTAIERLAAKKEEVVEPDLEPASIEVEPSVGTPPIFPRLDRLPPDSLPSCIKFLVEKGAPDDANYNESLLRLISFGLSRGYSQEQIESMAMEFAKRTSPNHSTTKASFKEKMANFRSAFSTAYRDREKYGTFHCNLILKGFSNNLIRQGGCGKHNEPCWPDPVREPASDLGFSKVDEMRELDTLAYCLKDHSLVTSKALSMNISSEAFRGGEIEAEGKSGRNFPMNRLLWLGLMAISRHEQGGFSDVEIIETINNLVITESVKGLKCQDPEKLESTLVFALSELRKRSPVSAETLELHLKSLKGIGLRLKALRQARSHLADLADRKVDLSTTLAQSAHSFDAMLANSSNSLFEAADAAFEDFEKSLFDGKNRYVPTPSKHFNELLNGGFQAGRLYGLGAPPKTGKTAFLWWQAQLAAEKGFPVVFCSYEIPAPELLTNAVSRIAKVDSRKLESRVWNQLPVESKDIIQSVKDGLRQYKQKTKPNVLLIEGGPDLPVATIRGAITLVRKHRGLAHDHPVLVIVDSLQKVPIGNEVFDNSVNETPRISRIVNELKWIARDMKVPVVAISEITKDSMNSALSDGNVEINCFKGSSGIQHGADCLMVLQSNDVERYDKEGDCNYSVDQLQLHYENMGKPDCLEQLEVKDHYPLDIAAHSCYARLSILMSRAGKSGDVMFRYDRAYHDFVPIDLQDLPKPGTSLGW